MQIQDITAAVDRRDSNAIRQAFRLLVEFPDRGEISTDAPGLLVVALNRVGGALETDPTPMPAEACHALDLPDGSTYAQGAQAAYVQSTRLARRFADAIDRRAGRPGLAAGRAI